MNSINFVILGNSNMASELGRKGTASDIAIYDKKTSDYIFTWTLPIKFPEKVQPLIQAVNIAEYAILNVAKFDKYLGEEIIALDYVNFKDGFILHSYDVDETKLKMLIRNTSICEFKHLDNVDQLKREMHQLRPKHIQGHVIIEIDHSFDVKGVGTVVLGMIKKGTVKVHDQLKIMPIAKDVLVKSIQMHDDPVSESNSPSRIGLAIKGIKAEDINRGDILCCPNTMQVSEKLCAEFTKSHFYKGDITENQTYLIAIGLQIKPAKVKLIGGGILEIISDRPIVFSRRQTCILLKPDSLGTRIIGKGIIQ